MKLQLERDVPAPIEEVWNEYTSPGNRARWDDTLESFEAIQGKPGYPGSLAHVTYQEGGVVIQTTEWVVERTAPIVYRAVYDSPEGILRLDNRFERTDEGTHWLVIGELRLKQLGLRLVAPLLRSKLRKRLEREMDAFSAYVTYVPAPIAARRGQAEESSPAGRYDLPPASAPDFGRKCGPHG